MKSDSEDDDGRIETQMKRNPAFNRKKKSTSRSEEVRVSELQKRGEEMNPGRMKRYDRSVRDEGERRGVRGDGGGGGVAAVSMSGYVIIV